MKKNNLVLLGVILALSLGSSSSFAGNFDDLEKVIRSGHSMSTEEYEKRAKEEIWKAVKTTDREMHLRILEISTGRRHERMVTTSEERLAQSEMKAAILDDATSKIVELRTILGSVLKNGGPSRAAIQIEVGKLMSSVTIRSLEEIREPDLGNTPFNVALEQAVHHTAYLHALLTCNLGF